MGAGASMENPDDMGPVVIGPDGHPRSMPRIRIVNLPSQSRPRRLPTYFCHSCERSFTHMGPPPRRNGPTISEATTNNNNNGNSIDSDNNDNNNSNTTNVTTNATTNATTDVTTNVTTNEINNNDNNSNINLLPGQVNVNSDTENSSTTTTTAPVEENEDEVRCPMCGGTFVEQTRIPAHVHNHHHRRRNENDLDDHQQIQFLLSILRQNILSQLEQAELNLALRESMETYKPNVTPASKSAISNLERYELTEDLLKAAQDPMCVICSEEFKVGDKVLSLPCKHLFHVECCEKWLEINNTCCVCREPIPEMKDQVDQDGDNENVKSSASYVNDVNNTNALANNVNNNNSLSSVEHSEEATVEQIETSPRTTFSTASNNSGMSGSLNRANVTNTVTTTSSNNTNIE